MSDKDFGDRFDLREFYELMYEYRTAPGADPDAVLAAFEAVREFARSTPKQGEAMPRLEFIGLPPGEMVPFGSFDADGETPATVVFKFCPSPSVEPAPWGESPTYDQLISELAACRDAIGDREGVIDECMQAVGDPLSVAAFVRAYVAMQDAPPTDKESLTVAPPQQVEPGWLVHIAGPDDLHWFSNEFDALRAANTINQMYLADRLKNPDNEVLCVATVQPAAPKEPKP